jgi:hypothetical protein
MKLSAMAAGITAIDVEHFDRIIHHHPFLCGFWLPARLHGVTTRPQLPVGPPQLPDALYFILETLIVGISLFRANEMQDREHIVGDTLVHVPQICDVPPAVFGRVMPGQ